MNAFNVHIFAIVKVKIENVVADSPAHATMLVLESVDLDALFANTPCLTSSNSPQITQVEYADDVQDFLVGELDDGEIVEQHTVDREHRPE